MHILLLRLKPKGKLWPILVSESENHRLRPEKRGFFREAPD